MQEKFKLEFRSRTGELKDTWFLYDEYETVEAANKSMRLRRIEDPRSAWDFRVN